MKKIRRIVVWGVVLFLLVVTVLIMVSPYGRKDGFAYRLVKHTVHIQAPADVVFRFLGNSGNATKWSVYVHHITTLNSDSVTDGMPGSRRRCFCKKDEAGKMWDETLIEVQPSVKRHISCYNFVGFPMNVDGIATEQLYEALPDSTCNLTFTFFISGRNPTVVELFKLYLGAYTLHSIFKRNLENVKAICEGKEPVHERED